MEELQDLGPIGLANRLCRHLLNDVTPASVFRPQDERGPERRKLQIKYHDALFRNIKNIKSRSREVTVHPSMTEVDKLFAHAYELRIQRRFDDANRLETLISELDQLQESSDTSCVENVLKFLLGLAGTGPSRGHRPLGHEDQHLPFFQYAKEGKDVIPNGPLNYGDTKLRKAYDPYYMQYPREIFEVPFDSIFSQMPPEMKMVTSSVCSQLPGSNLTTKYFAVQGLLDDTHEKRTSSTLFGALVNSNMTSMDIRLELPDLDDDLRAGLHTPSLSKIKELTVTPDEGFETNSASSLLMSPDVTSMREEPDIWEQALHYIPSRHHTWETVGCIPGLTERPYLTEAGPRAVDELCKMREADLRLVDDVYPLVKKRCISMKDLVRDVLYLLTGVLSKTFPFDKEKETFSLTPGVYLTGVSPDALRSLCQELIECGTHYYRLFKFSKPPVLNSLYTKGLVFQAYVGALRKYLHYYEACVLMVPHSKTIIEVNFMFHKIKPQMRFLAELCHCSLSPPPGNGGQNEEFPTGIQLMTYLYRVSIDNCATDHYPLVLSLLYTSCGPYLQFIQNWAFHGICRDNYEEFMIRINDDYLFSRDKHYWTSGYEMVSSDAEETVPLFLKDLADDIFTCGKSINLLKLCCPEHFMCNLDEESLPRVSITFSSYDLNVLHLRCQSYVSRMRQIAKQKMHSREEMKEREERAKLDLIQKARQAAAKEVDLFQAKMKEVRQAVDAKKRQLFQELKQQMEDDLERRQQEIQKEKDEDQARIDAVTRREGEELTQQQKIEEQAREELIEYYSKLTEEAARREQKALWKLRRYKLEHVRNTFLHRSEAELQVEWEKWKAEQSTAREPDESESIPTSNLLNITVGQPTAAAVSVMSESRNLLDMSIPYLPLSTSVIGAQSGNLLDMTLEPPTQGVTVTDGKHLLDMSIKDLPNWAQKSGPRATPGESAGTLVVGDSEENSEESGLPKWAQESSPGTLVVGDEEKETVDEKNVTTSLINLDETRDLPQWVLKNVDAEVPVVDDAKDDVGQENQGDGDDLGPVEAVEKASLFVGSRDSPAITAVKLVEGVCISQETEETIPKTQIMLSENFHISNETEEVLEKPHVKPVPGVHVNMESEDMYMFMPPQLRTPEQIYHDLEHDTSGFEIRQSRRRLDISPSPKKGEPTRNQYGHHSEETFSKATDKDEVRLKKFKGINVHGHASEQSDETGEKVVKRNVHGHHSEQSEKVDADAVRLKKFKDLNVHGHVSTESKSEGTDWLKVKKFRERNIHGHVSSQSDDVEQVKMQKFRLQNKYGHSSDSTVQQLLYGGRFGHESKDGEAVDQVNITDISMLNVTQKADESVWQEDNIEPYQDNFDIINEAPMVDITRGMFQGLFTLYRELENVDAYHYMSLPVLLQKSVTAPLLAQISLVNKSIVSYFYHDLEIDRYFEALRMYLFIEDGEFGQTLGEHLFEKLSLNPQPQEVLNPVFLNGILTKALRSSIHCDSEFTNNVSFAIKHVPHVFTPNASDALECFDLTYKVTWPINIVITENCLIKYGKVFTFMLQLKRAVWTLKDIWRRLSRDSMLCKAKNVPQVRQLQLFRHEMQCFVKVMQGYISNQIIHVSWQEFQEDLMNNVTSLDDLHHRHAEYLNKVIFRCLLNKKAAPVMKIIQEIFSLILRFHGQLVAFSWQESSKTGEIVHPAFTHMLATYKSFKNYSLFLFKVVNKLTLRGYQQHLDEFLLRLNFNAYYTQLQ